MPVNLYLQLLLIFTKQISLYLFLDMHASASNIMESLDRSALSNPAKQPFPLTHFSHMFQHKKYTQSPNGFRRNLHSFTPAKKDEQILLR